MLQHHDSPTPGLGIQGSIVALVTPMTQDGALDMTGLRRLVEHHIQQGSDAITVVGTTGESATLDEDEQFAAVQIAVEQAAGRVPIIAGTGANATSEAIRLTRHAKAAGADACLLITPYYIKPSQEGLYRHYRTIAEAVDIPQILYNVPGRTACDLLPDTIGRLAAIPNIIGIKEATGDLARVGELMALCGPGFMLYSGDDASACDFMLRGGKGAISVTANVAPRLMREMCAAAIAGDRITAKSLDVRLAPLHRMLFVESNPIPVKWALCELGLIQPGIRLPLTWLSDDKREPVRQAMRAIHALVAVPQAAPRPATILYPRAPL